MSQLLIQQYLNQLEALRKVSGTARETVVREAFKDLLKAWGRSEELTFIPEHEVYSPANERRYVDGALMHTLRVPFGYWEAKDTEDDLDAAIKKKFRAGYPKTNIIFENSHQAALIQHGEEVFRCFVEDVIALEKLLRRFFGYERPEIEAFRKAVEQFKVDLPSVLEALREMIEREYAKDPKFRKAAHEFLVHIKEAVNPSLTDADVREMLIQHVLTGEVFVAVFPGTTYHQDNNIARELLKLEQTFFTGNTRFQTLKGLEPYYAAIRKAAAEIQTHSEKQTFLKAIYENFYKVYNPKAADRLGVVYTPNEIVRFMIEGADWLCEKHFSRNLIDHDVQILDPAAGTGTFICEVLEHFKGQKTKLAFKYQKELHANEVAILPYYVANLNIEATYAAITGEYKEFPNLCFVDTLDNTFGLRKHKGHMDDIFGTISDINVQRIRNQNAKRISVIIGNPPYNANQLNENENNKNREYPEIDKRIKETYIDASTAQKTKLYDMYARFYRWASDRLDENGVLALITNRSFIDTRTFDGFRKVVGQEFNEIHIVDLGGDVRANPKLSGTKHNVFGIQTGVAISFMVKRQKKKGCRLFYARRPELETADEKLAFLNSHSLSQIAMEELRPTKSHQWVNQIENDFGSFVPLCGKSTKAARSSGQQRAIFALYANGIKTNRDEWLYAFDEASLRMKIDFLNRELLAQGRKDVYGDTIKWSRDLKLKVQRGIDAKLLNGQVVPSLWRPFVKKAYWANKVLSDILTEHHSRLYGEGLAAENLGFIFSVGKRGEPAVLATNIPPNYDMFVPDVGQVTSISCIASNGDHVDNITDWSLEKYSKQYRSGRSERKAISKQEIFFYTYAVLHDPLYRQQYAPNLKSEFPRIPFYPDFWKWSEWGKQLVDLHVNYEAVAPTKLRRTDDAERKAREGGVPPICTLRADKALGRILVDTETTLNGVPRVAWEYRIGSRSALEWVLDQYKEKTPRDPNIRAKFSTYRFSDHKDKVIDLLERVTTVSIGTQAIVEEMRKTER